MESTSPKARGPPSASSGIGRNSRFDWLPHKAYLVSFPLADTLSQPVIICPSMCRPGRGMRSKQVQSHHPADILNHLVRCFPEPGDKFSLQATTEWRYGEGDRGNVVDDDRFSFPTTVTTEIQSSTTTKGRSETTLDRIEVTESLPSIATVQSEKL